MIDHRDPLGRAYTPTSMTQIYHNIKEYEAWARSYFVDIPWQFLLKLRTEKFS